MAASTILGKLQVVLGSDTTNFDKSIDRVNRKLEGFGKKMTKIGSDLSMKVTAPLAAIGAAAVYTTAKFDDSMSKVQALTGAAGEELDKMRQLAKEMGSQTRYSASESADAMQYLALAGYDTNQILASTPAMLQLAAAAGMDLAMSADIVTDTMSAFQMKAEEAGTAADIFAKAQAKSNTNVEQLGEAMKYAAPIANSFQQNLQQTAAVLGVFADSGIKGSMAGTTYTSMLQDLKQASKDGAVAIGSTSVALYDAQGNARAMADILEDVESATAGMSTAQRDAALGAVFQQRSIKGVNILLATGTKRLRELEGELNNSEGSASKMAETMEDNLGGSLRSLRSATEGVLISFGEVLAPAVKGLADMLKNLMHWFDSLSATTKKWIVVVAGLAAAIGPALLAIGAISSLIPVLIGGFTAMLGPIGLVVLGIAALTAAFVKYGSSSSTAAKVSNEFSDSFTKQKEKVKDLEKNFKPLLARHDELKSKTNRSAKENEELDGIINQIAKTVPGAITAFDEYGRVMGVSTEKAKEFLKQQQAILKVKNAEAIKEQEENLRKLNNELDLYKRTIKEAKDRIEVSTNEGEISRMRKVITEMSAEIARVNEQKLGVSGWLDELKGIEPEIKKTKAATEEQAEATKKHAEAVSLLAAQHELLKKAQADRDSATNEKDLVDANNRIEAIQEEIDWLNNLKRTREELLVAVPNAEGVGASPIEIKWKLSEATAGWDKVIKNTVTDKDLGIDALKRVHEQFGIAEQSAKAFGGSYDLISEKTRILDGAISSLLSKGISADSGFVESLKGMYEEISNVTLDFSNVINEMLANVAIGFGEMIGHMISTGQGFDPSALLGPIASMMGQLGQMAIAAGVATLGIKAALESLNPFAAIAGGVALVALASVIKGSMSKMGSSIGGGGGGSISGGGNARPGGMITANKAPITVNGEWRASGTELKMVLDNQDRKDGRVNR